MILDAYLSDPETETLINDSALAKAMLEMEAALARVQGRLGLIPADAAARIDQVAGELDVDIAALGVATVRDGVPVIELLRQLRGTVGGPHDGYVHWGATSQDIVDTALALMQARVLALFHARLDELIKTWAALADRHRGTILAARTRNQQAVPTTFGLKVAGWLAPLLRHRRQHPALNLQFGGAGGTLSALGGDGPGVAAALAEELGLSNPHMPWHNQRDGIVEFANWLSGVSGILGRSAGEILLLAQTEVGEVKLRGAGGSSAMPQKANPVLAEAVLALARRNAGLVGGVHQAALHMHERDGTAWNLEWLTLPDMIRTTGAGLHHAEVMVQNLDVCADRMAANLSPATLAEAAVYALAEHMPKSEAQALVKAASSAAATGDLFDLLAARTEAPVDWSALRDPANYLGAANHFIDAVLKEIKP